MRTDRDLASLAGGALLLGAVAAFGKVWDATVAAINRDLKNRRKQKILDLWLACHIQQEIVDVIDISEPTVRNQIESFLTFGNIAN